MFQKMFQDSILEVASLLQQNDIEELNFKHLKVILEIFEVDSEFSQDIVQKVLNDQFLKRVIFILSKVQGEDKAKSFGSIIHQLPNFLVHFDPHEIFQFLFCFLLQGRWSSFYSFAWNSLLGNRHHRHQETNWI